MSFAVEIWSDIACPWCYVGKRRFEAALARFDRAEEVEVTWRSFQLDPEAPAEREGRYVEMLARKYGRPEEGAQAMLDEMTAMASAEGLEFRFDKIRPGNTLDGHRLVQLAATLGFQDAIKERLMRAYLTEGELIADHATLARLADEVGLPADRVAEVLGSDEFGARAMEEMAMAIDFGCAGVPFFVFDRQMAVPGAQPADILVSALEQAWDKRGT